MQKPDGFARDRYTLDHDNMFVVGATEMQFGFNVSVRFPRITKHVYGSKRQWRARIRIDVIRATRQQAQVQSTRDVVLGRRRSLFALGFLRTEGPDYRRLLREHVEFLTLRFQHGAELPGKVVGNRLVFHDLRIAFGDRDFFEYRRDRVNRDQHDEHSAPDQRKHAFREAITEIRKRSHVIYAVGVPRRRGPARPTVWHRRRAR